MSELNSIALKIISSGKGILAADESNGTMTKRLESVNVASSSESRLKFRSILFSSESMSSCVGGVILYDETINQSINSNAISKIISKSNSLPGIKVDTGAKALSSSKEEKNNNVEILNLKKTISKKAYNPKNFNKKSIYNDYTAWKP